MHTKGEWKINGDYIVGERYVCQLSDWIITGAGTQYETINMALQEERNANARLIAAAPAMLEALKTLLCVARKGLDQSATHDGMANCDAIVKAQAILAQVKGA